MAQTWRAALTEYMDISNPHDRTKLYLVYSVRFVLVNCKRRTNYGNQVVQEWLQRNALKICDLCIGTWMLAYVLNGLRSKEQSCIKALSTVSRTIVYFTDAARGCSCSYRGQVFSSCRHTLWPLQVRHWSNVRAASKFAENCIRREQTKDRCWDLIKQ